jgi:ABC-2 type transport system permease protein
VAAAPTLRFLRALVWTNLKASFALRGAFWLAVAFMFLNDLVWISVWWLFFLKFPSIAGWTLPDMMVLHGMTALAFGFVVVFGGGVRELARTIADGDLDVFLTQPKDPLLHVVASRTTISGWGDLAYGVVALGLAHGGDLGWILGGVAASLAGAVVFLSIAVVFHALAFWFGAVQPLARQVTEFLVTFCIYPDTLFSGGLRFVLFTVLPAAFVTWIPVALVREFSLGALALALGGAVAFVAAARAVFLFGLRRYESGSRFGSRA